MPAYSCPKCGDTIYNLGPLARHMGSKLCDITRAKNIAASVGGEKLSRKEESIRFRCTLDQKHEIEDAATKSGLGISGWILMIALREARLSTHR